HEIQTLEDLFLSFQNFFGQFLLRARHPASLLSEEAQRFFRLVSQRLVKRSLIERRIEFGDKARISFFLAEHEVKISRPLPQNPHQGGIESDEFLRAMIRPFPDPFKRRKRLFSREIEFLRSSQRGLRHSRQTLHREIPCIALIRDIFLNQAESKGLR